VDQANPKAHQDALWHTDRRTLLLATSFGLLLFLIAVAGLPERWPMSCFLPSPGREAKIPWAQ